MIAVHWKEKLKVTRVICKLNLTYECTLLLINFDEIC